MILQFLHINLPCSRARTPQKYCSKYFTEIGRTGQEVKDNDLACPRHQVDGVISKPSHWKCTEQYSFRNEIKGRIIVVKQGFR
jgi:hypothetical protein